MKKENLIAQLEGAKALSSQVDIDKVIELIQGLEAEVKVEKVFGFSEDLASTIAEKIQRTLERNSDEFVDRGSAQFEIGWDNRIELTEVDIDVYEVMKHVEAALEEFVIEEAGPEEEPAEEGVLPDWNTLAEEGVLRDEEE